VLLQTLKQDGVKRNVLQMGPRDWR